MGALFSLKNQKIHFHLISSKEILPAHFSVATFRHFLDILEHLLNDKDASTFVLMSSRLSSCITLDSLVLFHLLFYETIKYGLYVLTRFDQSQGRPLENGPGDVALSSSREVRLAEQRLVKDGDDAGIGLDEQLLADKFGGHRGKSADVSRGVP